MFNLRKYKGENAPTSIDGESNIDHFCLKSSSALTVPFHNCQRFPNAILERNILPLCSLLFPVVHRPHTARVAGRVETDTFQRSSTSARFRHNQIELRAVFDCVRIHRAHDRVALPIEGQLQKQGTMYAFAKVCHPCRSPFVSIGSRRAVITVRRPPITISARSSGFLKRLECPTSARDLRR